MKEIEIVDRMNERCTAILKCLINITISVVNSNSTSRART